MTIERARVIKADASPASNLPTARGPSTVRAPSLRAQRIAAEVLAARDEAKQIVAEAHAQAADEARKAAEAAATEARAAEIARLAASFLALEGERAKIADEAREKLVGVAIVLAERLVGEAIAVEPDRVRTLAEAAIREARGASEVRVDACPEDVAALGAMLGGVAITSDPTLGRGSLVVHTNLGQIDAKLETQLARLAPALREALR